MTTDTTLAGWTGPSSATEQDKQERTERMVKEAIRNHHFADCRLTVYAKGSYANNTNVKADSDVDIAVQCHNVEYWKEATPGAHPPGTPYAGIWTPAKLRAEVTAALKAKFPGGVDESGTAALTVRSSTARVDADVLPCFDYRYYFVSGGSRPGTKAFRKNGESFVNYPAQQLENGKEKNTRTKTYYKQAVRVLKRVENAMAENGVHREVQSFFIECLTYNCPDEIFLRSSWTATIKGLLFHIWDGLEGPEPSNESERWIEVNECKYLFHSGQKWSRTDGRNFANAAWNYLGFA
jgi:hypothetical protein